MIHDVVLPAYLGVKICTHRVFYEPVQTVRIRTMGCGCDRKLSLCIYQNEDRTFQMQADSSVDLSSATEITFNVWSRLGGGTLLLSKTLTGGDIVLSNPYTYVFDVSNAESGALTPGVKYCETWAILPGDDKNTLGTGRFRVIDTEKFD